MSFSIFSPYFVVGIDGDNVLLVSAQYKGKPKPYELSKFSGFGPEIGDCVLRVAEPVGNDWNYSYHYEPLPTPSSEHFDWMTLFKINAGSARFTINANSAKFAINASSANAGTATFISNKFGNQEIPFAQIEGGITEGHVWLVERDPEKDPKSSEAYKARLNLTVYAQMKEHLLNPSAVMQRGAARGSM